MAGGVHSEQVEQLHHVCGLWINTEIWDESRDVIGFHGLNMIQCWLVVWNMDFMTFHSVGNGIIIPTDFHSIIFQRGRAQPPTSVCGLWINTWGPNHPRWLLFYAMARCGWCAVGDLMGDPQIMMPQAEIRMTRHLIQSLPYWNSWFTY